MGVSGTGPVTGPWGSADGAAAVTALALRRLLGEQADDAPAVGAAVLLHGLTATRRYVVMGSKSSSAPSTTSRHSKVSLSGERPSLRKWGMNSLVMQSLRTSSLIFLTSKIAIPIPGNPVPYTLQTFGILVVGGLILFALGVIALHLELAHLLDQLEKADEANTHYRALASLDAR